MTSPAMLADLDGLSVATAPAELKRKSRDFYWFSPTLKRELEDARADLVVSPRDEAEVIAVAAACYRHGVPLTARGGGSGNYGQCMPLRGGVVLDMTGLDRLLWVKHGAVRVQAGKKLIDLDAELAGHGGEIRLFPSTRAIATVGGFIAGGSGGVGSINWGMLRERGNILGGRLVTLEPEPRVLELRGDDIPKFNHSYGVTGILTELELPVAPTQDWIDAIATFDNFMAAAHFGQAFAEAPGIVKKQCAVMAAPIPHLYLRPIASHVGAGQACALVMVAKQSFEALEALAEEHGGGVTYARSLEEVEHARAVPLYELCWNHTTLWALKRDAGLTYLQSFFPPGGHLELVEKVSGMFGDEVMMHLEFTRSGGGYACSALQIVRYTTEERLQEIMALQERAGCRQFNPHVFTLEEGGMKQVNTTQLAFKREVDPKGLLNPGKMLAWENSGWKPAD
ncbi:MAG: FAD-binding oxidoreductase [Hyphomonadaceae bacterium]|nr:FAD-binding oxidoreductase [Hyphomonadaceae bacterium]